MIQKLRSFVIGICFLALIGCGSSGDTAATTPAVMQTTRIMTDVPSTVMVETTTAPKPTEANNILGQSTTATIPPSANEEPSPTDIPEEDESMTPSAERAGNADVTYVQAVQSQDGSWSFHVTVEHPDTGWEDYADGWDVITPDGTVLKVNPDNRFTRLLLHPHENEQPFTRSQGGITIPEGVSTVIVRAHDLVDGYGGQEVVVDLTTKSGADFEVKHQ